MKTHILRCEACPTPHYALRIDRTIAKAHGFLWYDNNLVTDKYTLFPMTILFEEGKHASCTDKNRDGVYAPDNAIYELRPFPRSADAAADPVGGGWFVNRIYLKDVKLRDLSWNLLYTTSASPWFDGYFAVGWEWDKDDEATSTPTR